MVLLADEDAHDQGWPGRAAIAIARGWSAAGRRVILADADLGGAGLVGAWLGYFTIPGLMSTTGIVVSSPPFALFHPDARSEARG